MDGWLREVAALTGARSARRGERLQSLWSGYGEIVRVHLEHAEVESVVVKRVTPPARPEHPRGWSGARGHARKLRSYAVEASFYQTWARDCDEGCRVPRAWTVDAVDTGWQFVLEDLDASGFDRRRLDREGTLGELELQRSLDWLARFHALFLGRAPEGLWPVGTYWHLDTRPDEVAAMRDVALKEAAASIDARLREASFQTLVHGDAKLANLCFSEEGVAAVDFQYVGGGVGVKDVAYFLGSALDGAALEREADGWVEHYFTRLEQHLTTEGHDAAAVHGEWSALLPLAWADFERFLDGWAPDHWKRSPYARAQVRAALDMI